MSTSSDIEEVRRLASQILKHKRLYYSGHPEISDVEYDALENKLRSLRPHHPALQVVGGGEESSSSSNKVQHDVPMLSLNKTYKQQELESWMEDHKVVGTHKIDGASMSLIYENGELQIAKTRGNGKQGELVTEKINWVPDVPHKVSFQERFEVRGELFCDDEQFLKLCQTMEERGLDRPSSPRNIVAGVLGRKSDLDLATYFKFMAFDALMEDVSSHFKDESAKMKWLGKHGFVLPPYEVISDEKQLSVFLESVFNFMQDGHYGIDGAVLTYNDLELHAELGNTSHHPRYKISFKWQGQTASTKIDQVKWATSRLGIVTPVAVIQPVELSGAKITNVTLHNAAMVEAYNLKAGDQIEIVRSGEVIPKFLKVIKAASGDHEFPKKCPSCGSKLEFDDVRLLCPNDLGCPAQQVGRILNWIKAVSIDDLSEKRLLVMMEMDFVKGIPDLYRLDEEMLLSMPLTKEKMARKLLANIAQSQEVALPSFLQGLGISGGGLNTWEKILEHYPSLKQVRKLTVAQIEELDGFAEKSAQTLVSGLKKCTGLIDELLKVGVKPTEQKVISQEGATLGGQTFVITGSLSRPRSEIEKAIKLAGGKTSSSVSKKTTALVTNDKDTGSSKMKKAQQLEIPIWTENELFEKMERP